MSGKSNTPCTVNSVVREYGGMRNFALAYGEKPTPEGFEAARTIAEEIARCENEAREENQQEENYQQSGQQWQGEEEYEDYDY